MVSGISEDNSIRWHRCAERKEGGIHGLSVSIGIKGTFLLLL